MILAEKSLILLKSYPNELSKSTISRLEIESSLLKNAALRFEDVYLRVDIASIYEIKEAKVRDGSSVWPKSRKLIVCKPISMNFLSDAYRHSWSTRILQRQMHLAKH